MGEALPVRLQGTPSAARAGSPASLGERATPALPERRAREHVQASWRRVACLCRYCCCAGSPSLCPGFPWLQPAGSALRRGEWVSRRRAEALGARASVVRVHGLGSCGAGPSRSSLCGVSPDHNPLHQQADPYPRCSQGSPGPLPVIRALWYSKAFPLCRGHQEAQSRATKRTGRLP